MVLLSIGYESGKCDIYTGIVDMLSHFKDRGIVIGLVESDSDEMHFIKCVIKDDDSSIYDIDSVKASFYIYTSNIICRILMDSYQSDIINKLVKENYGYFNRDESAEIVNRCVSILNGTSANSGGDFYYYMNRKDRIAKKIYEYISDNTDIILEGFLRFRLKELNSEIEELIDRVAEEYLIEKEYNEFIKLLKYFVDIQESQLDTVNIVITDEGNYCMYDGSYNDITEELLRDMLKGGIGGEINYDDLLVSSLITAAPRNLIIHNLCNARNHEIIETIKNVFCERVTVCPGCSLCIDRNPVHKL